MPKSLAGIITLVVWVCWLVPLHGKKLAPGVFGGAAVQWTSAAAVAVLIPIAVFLGLRMLWSESQRSKGYWIIVGASIPLVLNLFAYGVAGIFLARTNNFLSSMHDRDAAMIAKLTERAMNAEEPERRLDSARAVFTMFGVTSAFRNSDEQMEVFAPNEEDVLKREETRELIAQTRHNREVLDDQLRQMPWLFGLHLGCFVVVLFCALAWQAYSRRVNNPTEPALDPPRIN